MNITDKIRITNEDNMALMAANVGINGFKKN